MLQKCFVLAIFLCVFAFIGAVKKFAVEELYSDDGKDKVEEHVDDENVEDVLERVDNAVEYGFQFGHSLDGLKRPQHAQNSQRLDGAQILARRASPVCDWGQLRAALVLNRSPRLLLDENNTSKFQIQLYAGIIIVGDNVYPLYTTARRMH